MTRRAKCPINKAGVNLEKPCALPLPLIKKRLSRGGGLSANLCSPCLPLCCPLTCVGPTVTKITCKATSGLGHNLPIEMLNWLLVSMLTLCCRRVMPSVPCVRVAACYALRGSRLEPSFFSLSLVRYSLILAPWTSPAGPVCLLSAKF